MVASARRQGQIALDADVVEKARNRAFVEDLADSAGDERCNRQHGELGEPLVVGDGQRIGDNDFLDAGIL